MFKTRKIQRRANEIYSQMRKENAIITITGESYYDSAYRINFYIDGRCYQARITDDSLPIRPGTTEQTNSIEIASFAACVIASKEYGRYPEKYIKTYNKCELIQLKSEKGKKKISQTIKLQSNERDSNR